MLPSNSRLCMVSMVKFDFFGFLALRLYLYVRHYMFTVTQNSSRRGLFQQHSIEELNLTSDEGSSKTSGRALLTDEFHEGRPKLVAVR